MARVMRCWLGCAIFSRALEAEGVKHASIFGSVVVGLLAPKHSYVSPSRFDAATAGRHQRRSYLLTSAADSLIPSALGFAFAVLAVAEKRRDVHRVQSQRLNTQGFGDGLKFEVHHGGNSLNNVAKMHVLVAIATPLNSAHLDPSSQRKRAFLPI